MRICMNLISLFVVAILTFQFSRLHDFTKKKYGRDALESISKRESDVISYTEARMI